MFNLWSFGFSKFTLCSLFSTRLITKRFNTAAAAAAAAAANKPANLEQQEQKS